MRTITVILLIILFCVWQLAFLKKVKSTWKKYIPTAIGGVGAIIGLAICFISYIPYAAKMYSQSTLSENQYFAITICVLFTPCLVGGLLGIVLEKFFGKKQILYFLPFIFSLITYLVAAFLGIGMISVKELVWLALFLTSGFLLSDEKVWGCLFGMIPGIVFIWMSTNYTGQVINIELPLGLIIIGFYLGCGAGIYRKRYLNKMQNKEREIMYRVSEEFHKKYFTMYDHMVRIFLKNGTEKTGLFNDEFYEDSSILVSCEVIKIEDIERMELLNDEEMD